MHFSAKVGFHAPTLGSLEGASPSDVAEKARQNYELSLHQIGRLLTAPEMSGASWPPSLLGEMLLTPGDPNVYRYVRTVDDAVRWHISVYGMRDPDKRIRQGRTMATACLHAIVSIDEQRWYALNYDENLWSDKNLDDLASLRVLRPPTADAPATYFLPAEGIVAPGCTFVRNSYWGWSLDLLRGPIPSLFKYRGDTLLSLLKRSSIGQKRRLADSTAIDMTEVP